MFGGFLLRLGALPGPGNTHSTPALLQFEQGCLLSHRTFLFLQVVHDLEFNGDGEAPFECGEGLLWLVGVAVGEGPLPLSRGRYESDAASVG